MSNGVVVAICIAHVARSPMTRVNAVEAIAGQGLKGDRYCTGEGSFNKEEVGRRQVTLINALFFKGSGFDYIDTRRNIVTRDVELMSLIGKEFQIGGARMRGVKYCDPCLRPSQSSGEGRSFKEAFFDRGGLIAEVLEGGLIKVKDPIVPPFKNY